MKIHHSHLRFSAILGAACGLLYAGLTALPDVISGCYGVNAGQGLCGLGFVIFNLPSSFVAMRLLGGEGTIGIGIVAIGNAVIFALMNVLVLIALRRSNWKILTVTNLLIVVTFFMLPFVIQGIF